jgi:hypothetical protein
MNRFTHTNHSPSKAAAYLVAMAVSFVAAGCVWSPRHESTLASKATPVKIASYALKPSATVKIECGHHWGGWQQVGTLLASAQPTEIWGDTLYPVSGSVPLPGDCWESAAEGFQTFLRFKQSTNDGDFFMVVFDQQGQVCVLQNGPSQGAIDAGYQCRRTENWIRVTAPF